MAIALISPDGDRLGLISPDGDRLAPMISNGDRPPCSVWSPDQGQTVAITAVSY